MKFSQSDCLWCSFPVNSGTPPYTLHKFFSGSVSSIDWRKYAFGSIKVMRAPNGHSLRISIGVQALFYLKQYQSWYREQFNKCLNKLGSYTVGIEINTLITRQSPQHFGYNFFSRFINWKGMGNNEVMQEKCFSQTVGKLWFFIGLQSTLLATLSADKNVNCFSSIETNHLKEVKNK